MKGDAGQRRRRLAPGDIDPDYAKARMLLARRRSQGDCWGSTGGEEAPEYQSKVLCACAELVVSERKLAAISDGGHLLAVRVCLCHNANAVFDAHRPAWSVSITCIAHAATKGC